MKDSRQYGGSLKNSGGYIPWRYSPSLSSDADVLYNDSRINANLFPWPASIRAQKS